MPLTNRSAMARGRLVTKTNAASGTSSSAVRRDDRIALRRVPGFVVSPGSVPSSEPGANCRVEPAHRRCRGRTAGRGNDEHGLQGVTAAALEMYAAPENEASGRERRSGSRPTCRPMSGAAGLAPTPHECGRRSAGGDEERHGVDDDQDLRARRRGAPAHRSPARPGCSSCSAPSRCPGSARARPASVTRGISAP